MTNAATDRVRKDWDSQADKWFEERESLLEASRAQFTNGSRHISIRATASESSR